MNNYQTPRHPILIIVFMFPILMVGCSSETKIKFENPKEALETCESFLHSIQKRKYASIDELIHFTKQWTDLADSAMSCIERDTLEGHGFHAYSAFNIFRDSISNEFERLAESRPRTLQDYYKALNELCNVNIDKQTKASIEEYTKFFNNLDTVRITHTTTKRTVLNYELELRKAHERGFRTKQDVLRFIASEDKHFRSFLNHLPMLKGISCINIKMLTEQVTADIFTMANNDSTTLSKPEAVVLMTMRTNRRLIQNAKTCIADIKKGRISKSGMEQAYALMLLQPWLTLDDFSLCLATAEQRKDLQRLADETPAVMKSLKPSMQKSLLNPEDAPAMLLTNYIDSKIYQ